mgnify:FL=1
MKNKIEIKNLTKHYGGFTLDNVSFSVPRGSVVGLIGENGAGKSTIIKSLLGVINTDGGEILFDSVPLGRLGKNQRQLTGVVLDDVSLPSAVNLRELNTVMKNMFSRWDEQTFFALTERFRLPRDKKTGEFSKGMKMKTAIAAALSHGAETLILDEPTSGLDPVARDEILDILYDFMQNSGHAVLISSHITSDLEKLCDYVVFIHGGKVAVSGEKDALLEEYAVYGGNISDLDPAAVVRVRRRNYGADALVKRSMIPPSFGTEKTTLEDIMLFFVKGEKL